MPRHSNVYLPTFDELLYVTMKIKMPDSMDPMELEFSPFSKLPQKKNAVPKRGGRVDVDHVSSDFPFRLSSPHLRTWM